MKEKSMINYELRNLKLSWIDFKNIDNILSFATEVYKALKES